MQFRTMLVLTLVLLTTATATSALDVEASWGHRKVAHGWFEPPQSVVEGSILGTFIGDEPMDLIGGDPRFQRLSDTTFQRRVNWDEIVPILAVFQGQVSGEVDSVWTTPAPLPSLTPGGHAFPVVHLETDPAALWSDETGLFVWGDAAPNWDQRGELWERPAQLTIWDTDGTLLVERPVGYRINGDWSRCIAQKSLRLYFDREGQPPLTHHFFGDDPVVSERLLLRQTMFCEFMLKDHWATSLYHDLGHLTSRWTPSIAYLNGEYWGIYGLRERLDDEWATTTLGLDGDAIILVKDGETIHGDPGAWPDFLDWVDTWLVPGSHEFFQEVSRRLDLESYTDWLFINVAATAAENGFFHNLVMLRGPDGRWQTVMWDEDNIIFAENIQADLLRFYSANDSTEFHQYAPMFTCFPLYDEVRLYCRLFRQLMGNPEYRALLAERANTLLDGPLSIPTMLARMDSVQTLFSPEVPLFAPRFTPYGDLAGFEGAVQAYRWILAQRHPVLREQLTSFLDEHRDPVELSWFSATAGPDEVALQWRTERERDNVGFTVLRAVDDPDQLVPIADHTSAPELAGAAFSDTARVYAFVDTEAPADTPVWYQLQHLTTIGITITHDWLERVGPVPLPTVVVNEFLADNETVLADEAGEYDDWLELYNPGPEAVALGDLYLTDDLANPLRWHCPPGTLQPGEFLLVWCDDDTEQGPHHTSFKLSASGEEIGIATLVDTDVVMLDQVVFGQQTADVSQARIPDGDDTWVFTGSPTPGSSNQPLAAPDEPLPLLRMHAVTPNPGGGPATIDFSLGIAETVVADVFDLRGRRVRRLHRGRFLAGEQQLTWDRRDEDGRPVAAGMYLLRLRAAGSKATVKIAVVR